MQLHIWSKPTLCQPIYQSMNKPIAFCASLPPGCVTQKGPLSPESLSYQKKDGRGPVLELEKKILFENFCIFFFFFLNSRRHTKRRAGTAPRACPSFGMTMTQDIRDLSVLHFHQYFFELWKRTSFSTLFSCLARSTQYTNCLHFVLLEMMFLVSSLLCFVGYFFSG